MLSLMCAWADHHHLIILFLMSCSSWFPCSAFLEAYMFWLTVASLWSFWDMRSFVISPLLLIFMLHHHIFPRFLTKCFHGLASWLWAFNWFNLYRCSIVIIISIAVRHGELINHWYIIHFPTRAILISYINSIFFSMIWIL